MNYTQNYHLGLPIPAERYDVSIVNANNTVIDGQLKTNADAITNHKNDHNNPHGVTAAQVGLGNVNNTADSAKPVSTPQSQYIASAVAAEATRATNAEGALSDRITTAAGEISAEVTRATGVESTLSTQITNEVTRAQGAESGLRDYVDEKLSVTYKASGSVFFADLPTLAASREGHVYNIKDGFTTTADFVEGAGKDYPAGTNVAIVEKDEESYEAATVEEGDNPSEMGLYELDGTDYVLTEDTAPVEGKTYYELVVTPAYYYDVLAGFVDTSDFITDTDYATTQAAGIVKPDGTTITVDANGVISSIGGGDVSSEEMADVVNILGAKNLIPPKTGEMQVEIDDNTVTFREDGSAYISGQWGSGQPTYTYTYNMLPKGRYTISINNEDAWGVWLYAEVNGNVVAHSDTDSSFTLNSEQDVWFGIGFDEQHSGDRKRIWPTCIPCHIKDQNFVAFAKTNKQLTVDVNKINPRLNSILNFLGSKNLLPPKPGLEPVQVDHADVTFNSDGSITIDGSCGQSEETLISSTVLPKGKYELVVNQEEQQSGVGVNIYDGNHNLIARTDWLDDFTLTNDTEVFFYLVLYQGFQEQDYTIFPMVQPADMEQYDNAPYAKTNRQLTEDVETLQQTTFSDMTGATSSSDGTHGLVPAPLIADREKFLKGDGTWSGEIGDEISDIVNVLGAKNLLPNNAVSQIVNGVTFTVNSDSSVTANGTATEDTTFQLIPSEFIKLPKGKLIVSGGHSNEKFVYINFYNNGAYVKNVQSKDDEVEFDNDYSNYNELKGGIVIRSGQTLSNETFYPMVRPASIKDDIYVPYAMTNRELTVMPRSYVGMIIHSTTLDTMAKVVAFYGGTTWIRHSGYFLRGASSGVVANSATSTGGADTVTLTVQQIPSHAHLTGISSNVAYGAGPAGNMTAQVSFTQNVTNTSYTGGGQAHNNVPLYKSVYIWERTV